MPNINEWCYCNCISTSDPDDLTPTVECGCGENHCRLYRDTVIHWRDKHWLLECAFRAAVEQQFIIIESRPNQGFTLTSPLVPELMTEADSMEEALVNTADVLATIVKHYRETKKPFPSLPAQSPSAP